MYHYFILALCLLFGQLFHLLIKANAMRKRAKSGNVPFNIMKDFIAVDGLEIIATFVGGIIVMLILNEVKMIYPGIENYLRMSFVLLGYSGSSLVLSALSKAEKNVSKQIDEKTNHLEELTSHMNHWVFYPALTSASDVVETIGQQPYGVAANGMSAQTQGVYYTQVINSQIYLCAQLSAFSTPITASIRISGTQQLGYHDPIQRPK